MRASYGMFYDHPLLGLAFDSDVADATQAPQIVLFGGSPTSGAAGCNLNAANTFMGILNCPGFTYLPNQQRFDPTPNTTSLWTNQNFLATGIPLRTMLPFGFPTAKDFQYSYSNQVNLALEHDFGHNFSLGLQYNFNGGRHLNRPINANAVHTDLLVANWKNALAAGDPGAQEGPLSVGSVGLPCGVGPTGVPWVSPAIVNFFRPSGTNPSFKAALSVPPLSGCNPAVQGLLSLDGLGLGCGCAV